MADSAEADIYYSIEIAYRDFNYDSAIRYAQKCLTLSEKIGYKRGIANGCKEMGTVCLHRNNYQNALEYYQKAADIRQEIGDKIGVADVYCNMGSVYRQQGNNDKRMVVLKKALSFYEEAGDKKDISDIYSRLGAGYEIMKDYPEALKYYFKSLKIKEEIKDAHGMPWLYNCIGEIYYVQEIYSDAMLYYRKALEMSEEPGSDKLQNRYAYVNIANTYFKQGNYSEALIFHETALKKMEAIGDKSGSALENASIGDVYKKQDKLSDATTNYLKALNLFEELKDTAGIAKTCISLGEVDKQTGSLQEALNYENKGLLLAQHVNSKEDIQDAYSNLAEINALLKNFAAAYDYHVKFEHWKDSNYLLSHSSVLTQMEMTFLSDKRQDSIKADQVKKDAVKENEIRNQRRLRNYTLGGFAIVVFFLIFVFVQRNKIRREKKHSDDLLLNILPAETAEELKRTGGAKTRSFDMVTVLFTDFKNFTRASETMSAEDLVSEMHYCYSAFDRIMAKYGVEKIKTIGDGYMAAGGLPVANSTNPIDTVRAAMDIAAFMDEEKARRQKDQKPFFDIRIGLHTGHVVAGIVGIKKFAYDIWGDTVNIASRMESSGEAGKVNISGATYEYIKDTFKCTYRGKVQAKNKGEIDMYFVENMIQS